MCLLISRVQTKKQRERSRCFCIQISFRRNGLLPTISQHTAVIINERITVPPYNITVLLSQRASADCQDNVCVPTISFYPCISSSVIFSPKNAKTESKYDSGSMYIACPCSAPLMSISFPFG